jgi:hypothetical protein
MERFPTINTRNILEGKDELLTLLDLLWGFPCVQSVATHTNHITLLDFIEDTRPCCVVAYQPGDLTSFGVWISVMKVHHIRRERFIAFLARNGFQLIDLDIQIGFRSPRTVSHIKTQTVNAWLVSQLELFIREPTFWTHP